MQAKANTPEDWIKLATKCYKTGDWERTARIIHSMRRNKLEHPQLQALEAALKPHKGRPKVFCIGRNKTGTTSLEGALASLGLRMALQARGEMLLQDWARRDFRRILHLCTTADAFQDSPFSLPYTWQAVDAAFPGSKFILTLRESPEQWFASLVRFHTRLVGKGRIPTAEDLANFPYRYKGFLWEAAKLIHGIDAAGLYDKDIYIAHYLNHNRQVIDYFRHRPGDLLVLNVAETGAMEKLCTFLGQTYEGQAMPHMNRSA